jgi:hypothetical protein
MASGTLYLAWEWPAERAVTSKLVIRISNIKAHSTGWFGIGRSPSIAGVQPDPTDISGEIILGPASLNGREVSLTVPKVKAQTLKVGNLGLLGVVDDGKTVICVEEVPDLAGVELNDWVRQKVCQ